uniref:Immunoglobulin V-set domain-containing protein n=2 Tax=Sus scrofa TaxID=9823 RepID=A0A8D1IDC8_PIG
SLSLRCPAMILVIDFSGGTRAQSVTQLDSHITVPEGDSRELRCNYSSFPHFLFWYMQYPNQGLQLFLKYTSGNSLISGIRSFEAELRKRETSFNLRKISACWSYLAKYFCVLSDTVTDTVGDQNTTLLRLCSLKDSGSRPVSFSRNWHLL